MARASGSVARALLARARTAQLAVGAETAALIVELGEEYLAGRLTTQELQLALMSAEKLGFISSTQVAVNHLEELRALYRAGGNVTTPEFNLQAAGARAQSTIDALARATGIGLQRDVFGTAAVWGDRAAKMGGRETVVLSARASGRRWRRVTDGNPCAFCATLATRGILDKGYRSEESALWTKTGEKYHDRCGCTAAEIIEDLPLTAQEKAWVEQYQSAADLAHAEGLPATPETVLPTMRNQGNFHDSPTAGAARSG